MLRKGRGDGYRAALKAQAVDDVIACVVEDPRWDRQVENRDDYYATLLIEIGADVQPIVDCILDSGDQADESACWLPIGVLAKAVSPNPTTEKALSACLQCTAKTLPRPQPTSQ
jgi:hypothetical protein